MPNLTSMELLYIGKQSLDLIAPFRRICNPLDYNIRIYNPSFFDMLE